jgi:hypothetical protein
LSFAISTLIRPPYTVVSGADIIFNTFWRFKYYTTCGAGKDKSFPRLYQSGTTMSILQLLEIVLVVLILRALFPVAVRLMRWGLSGGRGQAKRFEEDRFDKKKMDIEDGEYKEIK